MVISRTPYRISFLGGGTDYHTWYQQHGAAVLTTTINHYCYLSCRYLPPFFEHTDRIVWSKIEQVKNHSDIEHPAVRAVVEYLKIDQGLEVHHQGDLPARSGLGSSSAFTVGMLNALYGLNGLMSTKRHLACEAVHIERDILKENVGVQDQIQTAHGGLNKITIHSNGDFQVEPLILPPSRLNEFHKHLLLFFTGISRHASNIAGDKIKAIPKKQVELHTMREMVDQGIEILCSQRDINEFGQLLHDAWQIKQSLADSIAPTFVDEIYQRARRAGAIGGKVLGAGGGGFMLFFVKPSDQPRVMEALSDLLLVPFEFENGGSQIIYCDQVPYSLSAMHRRDFRHLQHYEDEKTNTTLLDLHRNRKSKLTRVDEDIIS